MDEIFFSIITPTFNRAKLLNNTIVSVLNQTFKNWELIIIDDASTDNTYNIVHNFNEKRIKYIKNNVNLERSRSRNKGIEAACGEYICFLDSDDLWEDDHLKNIYNYLINNNLPKVLIFTNYKWLYENGNYKNIELPNPDKYNPVEYIIEYQPLTSSVCIPAKILKKFKFKNELTINEDVELFARIATQIPIIKLNNYSVNLLIHKNNTRNNTVDYITPQIEVFKLLCKQKITGKKISKKFKKKRIKLLKIWLIRDLEQRKEIKKMKKEIIKFLLLYPFTSGNYSRIVSLIYNMPGGKLLKSIIRAIKRYKS
ncbi:MAG TPA: glycosyltransferase family A protein [Bacteroidales bacterium]|nr:glycosyltransferase family A protein [Bacteroidales bacterium]